MTVFVLFIERTFYKYATNTSDIFATSSDVFVGVINSVGISNCCLLRIVVLALKKTKSVCSFVCLDFILVRLYFLLLHSV